MEHYYLYTFESTHGAISTEKLMKSLGCTVMPVPRSISTSCGISVRVETEKVDESVRLFKAGSELADDEYTVYSIESDKKAGIFNFQKVTI